MRGGSFCVQSRKRTDDAGRKCHEKEELIQYHQNEVKTMIQYERFAACMKRLLDEKQMSVAELSRKMGYKSRNSVFRILNDQTSSDVEAAFLATLKEKNCIDLTPEQWLNLDQALEISRIGYADYCSNKAIRALMMGQEAPHVNFMCMESSDEHGGLRWRSMEEVLVHYLEGAKLDIVLTGGCNASLFALFARTMIRPDLQCRITMKHYVFGGQEEIVQNIAAIQSLLYAPWYMPYLLQPDTCSPEAEALLRTTTFLIRAENHHGEISYEQFNMVDSELLCSARVKESVFSFFDMLITRSKVLLSPLRSQFVMREGGSHDYVAYTSNYGRLEKNRSIYSIRPDIPVNYIHPDILMPSLREGVAETHLAQLEHVDAMIKNLYDVHLNRWMNFFNKKKVTHTVISRKGMEKLVRTGRQADHFFAMRPFTVLERRQLLTFVREQAANNPYFSLYFLKEEPAYGLAEMTMYEGLGLMLTKAGTDYCLEKDHAEVMINHPMMMDKFKSYFMKDVLVNRVYSQQENLAILDEMIHLLG